MTNARVGVIMGSDSDWSVMSDAADTLAEFDVAHEVGVYSAHRTPQRMLDYAQQAAGRGIDVIIAGAGGAAHLPGMVASATPLPVIGVPVPLAKLGRAGLAAVDRADAGRGAGGHRVDRRRAQRRPARSAHPGGVRSRSPQPSGAFQEELAESVLAKDSALKQRQGKVTGK